MEERKILIGGRALEKLGSKRSTEDIDYLVNRPGDDRVFIEDGENDLVNVAAHDFFSEIWDMADEDMEIASPQMLAELKAYGLVQHAQNMNLGKADDCEYDLKFLAREYDAYPKKASAWMKPGQWDYVKQTVANR